jgi:RNA polymerase sigma-70 factor (ECF subfamily)
MISVSVTKTAGGVKANAKTSCESGIFTLAGERVSNEAAIAATDRARQMDGDMELLAQMIANKPRAWREFQTRYERLIQRCILKVTRRFSSIVSQDDVREIHAQLLVSLLANDKHKLRSFDPERGNRFSSWVGLLAINCAYDYLRSLKREPNKAALSEAVDLVCDMPDPFDQASNKQRAEIAARMLADFSEKDRDFATLYFGEGMDPTEIAVRMNISVKTVYSKKHKIQSRLESFLAQNNAADGGFRLGGIAA